MLGVLAWVDEWRWLKRRVTVCVDVWLGRVGQRSARWGSAGHQAKLTPALGHLSCLHIHHSQERLGGMSDKRNKWVPLEANPEVCSDILSVQTTWLTVTGLQRRTLPGVPLGTLLIRDSGAAASDYPTRP